ncbi:hypothetical protein HYC85_012996 [Camellia sinensis]|uniref:Alpha/beta hydrolase fold-3 domain-containing protein n=1 Tax=Camellia sinensis TaxID=4442 RepID=A0A7J7HDL3_CAMSI|nr:hypothetical protein HYC85_012996 [Camellia sinensis]
MEDSTTTTTANSADEIAHEFLPLLRVYKDGTVHRLHSTPPVPPSVFSTTTAVSSKDLTISPSTGVTARIYLPPLTTTTKLPILVYFHGGGFCVGSAFSATNHRYLTTLSSQSTALAVSIEYRLSPEHPLPTAYHDSWAALQWVASHYAGDGGERWLNDHGDFNRVFVGGDSAGGNIAHNMAMKAGRERLPNGVRILGVIAAHPYFWGADPIGSDPVSGHEDRMSSRLWKFVYPECPGGLDDPTINPCGPGAPSLAGLGCSRLLVCVAEKDALRERNVKYYEAVRDSGWVGEVELYEAEGEEHVFHISNPESENTKIMLKRLVSFIQK